MISQVGRGTCFSELYLEHDLSKNLTLAELYKVPHRILDHRVFVNGEIDTFLDKFELKRNDSEVESLFQVTEIVGSLKYDLSERCITLGNQSLTELATAVNNLLNGVETLLQKAKVEREVRIFKQ